MSVGVLPRGNPAAWREKTSAATATSSRRRSIDDDGSGMTGFLTTRRQWRAPILANARGVVESHRRGHLSPIGRTRTIRRHRAR